MHFRFCVNQLPYGCECSSSSCHLFSVMKFVIVLNGTLSSNVNDSWLLWNASIWRHRKYFGDIKSYILEKHVLYNILFCVLSSHGLYNGSILEVRPTFRFSLLRNAWGQKCLCVFVFDQKILTHVEMWINVHLWSLIDSHNSQTVSHGGK